MNPFDFLNAINDNKKDLFEDPQAEKDYSVFMVNRGLSYFPDTILYANEMNKNHELPKKWQFDFYLHSVPRRKRFSKWYKKENSSDVVKLVANHYKYSERKAYEIMDILTSDQINHIRMIYETGGRNP